MGNELLGEDGENGDGKYFKEVDTAVVFKNQYTKPEE